MRDEVVSFTFKFFPQASDDVQERRRRQPIRMVESKPSTTNIGLSSDQKGTQEAATITLAPVKVEEKVGRNDPCPCGSGKKYKHCHGR
jgi:preprotein translocase subunit SecA